MATVWKRPDTIAYPTIWRVFEGRKEVDGEIPKFEIVDITEDQYDTVLDMMVKKFIKRETEIMESRDFWQKCLEQRLSFFCLVTTKQRKDEIVSIVINYRLTPYDPKVIFEPKTLLVASVIHEFSLQKNNFCKQFDVDEVITDIGGFTNSKYSGQNVNVEMIKCRELLCKAIKIKMTITITTPDCQKDLEKLGFKDYGEITTEELKEITKMPLSRKYRIKLMYNSYQLLPE